MLPVRALDPAPIPPADIKRALDRILESETFSRSERMKRFLSFTVSMVLEGRTDELKEYSIGVAAFDKPENFDPRLDPIVRVEAGRLRTKLKEYYEREGREDCLQIYFPKRSYVPQFHVRTQEA
jgi:adenylate cyclase